MHKPPVAKRVPVTSLRHGHEVVDEYAWLRDRDDPDTVAYLEAENAYTDEWFAPLADLQDRLFDEIKSRILETDLSVPARRGPWWYVTRTEEGRQYPIFCRRPAATTTSRRAGAARRERARRRPRLLRARRPRRQPEPPPARVRRPTSPAARSTPCASATSRPGTTSPTPSRARYYGTAWSADDALPLLHDGPTTRMRPYQVWRHELGTPTPRRRARLPGGRRATSTSASTAPAAGGSSSSTPRAARRARSGSSTRRRPDGAAQRRRAARSRASSTASTTRATGC